MTLIEKINILQSTIIDRDERIADLFNKCMDLESQLTAAQQRVEQLVRALGWLHDNDFVDIGMEWEADGDNADTKALCVAREAVYARVQDAAQEGKA